MLRKLFVALALALSLSPAAWGGDAKDDTLEGTWRPSAAELRGDVFPDEVRKGACRKGVSHGRWVAACFPNRASHSYTPWQGTSFELVSPQPPIAPKPGWSNRLRVRFWVTVNKQSASACI
jgi:hypothetical protein